MSKTIKKTRYRRSTPVTRVRRNVEKVARHARLVAERLEVWKASGDGQVLLAIGICQAVEHKTRLLDECVARLELEAFVPPRKSAAVCLAEGQHVRVVDKHRPKYEEAFAAELRDDPEFLNDLVVANPSLPSGEVSVRRGKRTSFIVRKTHLASIAAVW
jgi:hypothetical protein